MTLYKVTNPTESEKQFRDTGKVVIVKSGKSVIASQPPTEDFWKIKEIEKDVEEIEESSASAEIPNIEWLKNIKGVDTEIAQALIDRFGVDGITTATIEDLEKISGIGKRKAKIIFEELKK